MENNRSLAKEKIRSRTIAFFSEIYVFDKLELKLILKGFYTIEVI